MYYTIYKITNKINGKIYIGQHVTKNLNDGYMGSGKHIRYSIRKYGLDNFKKEILFVFDNEECMCQKEQELVTEEFCKRKDTYNIAPGGFGGGFRYINSNKLQLTDKHKEHYKKIFKLGSKAFVEKYKDSTLSEQHKKKISLTRRKQISEIGHNWSGKKHTTETLQKMRESMKGLQAGSKNSQYGTMWITNGFENKKIKKQDTIPEGYRNGRTYTNL